MTVPTGDLFGLLNMAWAGQAVYVAAQLKIADILRQGPQTVEDLAELTQTDGSRLEMVLQALAAFGIFARDAQGRFTITPAGAQLREGQWMREYALLWGEQLYSAGGQLLSMMTKPETGFEMAHGQPLYEFYRQVPQGHERFASFMSSVTEWQCTEIAQVFDCSQVTHLVDVGGGRGAMMAALLGKNPHLRGLVFDQPSSQCVVEERMKQLGFSDRVDFVAGDFFQNVPSGSDSYLIKHVLHDWNDASTVRILSNISQAMNSESKLIILEAVCSEENETGGVVKLRGLEQLFWTGGGVRTRKQWDELLKAANLIVEKVSPTAVVDASLIFCKKMA